MASQVKTGNQPSISYVIQAPGQCRQKTLRLYQSGTGFKTKINEKR